MKFMLVVQEERDLWADGAEVANLEFRLVIFRDNLQLSVGLSPNLDDFPIE